jgi:hypothetical protein
VLAESQPSDVSKVIFCSSGQKKIAICLPTDFGKVNEVQ